jgi:Na+-translocating ferredoxin:NAD+ oxidoreductase RnfD subunit
MSSASQTPGLPVTVMGSLIVLANKRADWNMPVSYIKYMSPCSACGFSTKQSKHNFESGHFQTFFYFF